MKFVRSRRAALNFRAGSLLLHASGVAVPGVSFRKLLPDPVDGYMECSLNPYSNVEEIPIRLDELVFWVHLLDLNYPTLAGQVGNCVILTCREV
jgi:hypothetical protein